MVAEGKRRGSGSSGVRPSTADGLLPGRATIEDVAAAAGVSVATVSRALRGLPNVAPATRSRVVAAAAQLAYRPDPHASRLAAGRTFTIGMAVPSLGQWYFGQVVAGAEAVLSRAGYDVLVMGVGSAEERKRRVVEWALVQKRVDGLILVDLRLDPDEVRGLREAGAAVATVGDRYAEFSSVTIDNRTAAIAAMRHLIGLGHRRIGLLGDAPPGQPGFSVPLYRRSGYRYALEEAGIVHDPALEVPTEFTIASGAEGMRTLLTLADPPTAVFAMSDEIAMGAMQAAREAGIDVPGRVSIIGFDDHDVADVVGLTTIRQPVGRSGALAARFVIDQVEQGASAQHAVEDVELVRRATTAVPPAR